MLCECPPGGRVKNRYKYSLIFLSGVDTTHACILFTYRCNCGTAVVLKQPGPASVLATPLSPHHHPYGECRKRHLTTCGGERLVLRTPGNPLFHHGGLSSPFTPLRPRFPLQENREHPQERTDPDRLITYSGYSPHQVTKVKRAARLTR